MLGPMKKINTFFSKSNTLQTNTMKLIWLKLTKSYKYFNLQAYDRAPSIPPSAQMLYHSPGTACPPGRHLCMPSFSTLEAQPPSYERDAIPDIIWQLSHGTLEA